MKSLRTYLVLSFVFLTFECDDCNLNGLFEDCEEDSIGWVRVENTSSIYSYDINVAFVYWTRLLPNETSRYQSVSALTYHSVEWSRVDCNGSYSDCNDYYIINLNICESKTLKLTDY